jgi:hypothetical protein
VPETKDVGPSHIKQNYWPNDGIWYPDDPDDPDDPDGSNVRLVWHGGSLAHDKHTSNGEFNPFTVQNSLTRKMHVLNFHIL